VHCTTQPELRGVFWTLASAPADPNYLLLLSEYFRCIQEVPRMPRSAQKLSRSLEVNLELSIVQREVSIEVKSKARVLDNIIISRSLETVVQGSGVHNEVK